MMNCHPYAAIWQIWFWANDTFSVQIFLPVDIGLIASMLRKCGAWLALQNTQPFKMLLRLFHRQCGLPKRRGRRRNMDIITNYTNSIFPVYNRCFEDSKQAQKRYKISFKSWSTNRTLELWRNQDPTRSSQDYKRRQGKTNSVVILILIVTKAWVYESIKLLLTTNIGKKSLYC